MSRKGKQMPVSVTIVVTQRERFSATTESLESIYRHTDMPFELVYVTANAPKKIQQLLEQKSQEHGFSIVQHEGGYLTPNQARNLGFRSVDTDYCVFIDNDVLVQDGWLDALVNCAEETGADVVGPTYLIGRPEKYILHLTQGKAYFTEENGIRTFRESHVHSGDRLSEVASSLKRQTCDFVEFHCMLVRAEALRKVRGLDEGLRTAAEHIDACMAVTSAGGKVYTEPASVVAYVPASHFLNIADLRFYLWRWSDPANKTTLAHFRVKHDLREDDPFLAQHDHWLRAHRRRPLRWLNGGIRRLFGESVATPFCRITDRLLFALTPK